MRVRRVVWMVLASLATALLVAGLGFGSVWLYLHPPVERTNGVVYGQRQGGKLAMDVLRPAQPNGVGVMVMVSGGWKSSTPGSFQPWMAAPLLRRGYTVFAVYHVSQPEATGAPIPWCRWTNRSGSRPRRGNGAARWIWLSTMAAATGGGA